MDRPAEERPAVEQYADGLKLALEEREEGKGDFIEAVDREIAAEAEGCREYLQALEAFDHALTLSLAIVEAMEQTDSPRYGWLKRTSERADEAQQKARARANELEADAKPYLERIQILHKVRDALVSRGSGDSQGT